MDSYLIAINSESAVSQDPPKVVGVVTAHIHKVKLTIKMEGLVSFTVQPLLSSYILFEHYQGSAGFNVVTVPEYAATAEPIDEIEPEFIAGGVGT